MLLLSFWQHWSGQRFEQPPQSATSNGGEWLLVYQIMDDCSKKQGDSPRRTLRLFIVGEFTRCVNRALGLNRRCGSLLSVVWISSHCRIALPYGRHWHSRHSQSSRARSACRSRLQCKSSNRGVVLQASSRYPQRYLLVDLLQNVI